MTRPARPAVRRMLSTGALVGLLVPGAAAALPAPTALAADPAPGTAVSTASYDCFQSGLRGNAMQDGPFSDSASSSGDTVRVAVDPERQRARGYAKAQWDPSQGRTFTNCRTTSTFENVYTVLPGTSGLQAGDPVRLVLTPEVDASLDERTPVDQQSSTHWRLDAGYRVTTPNDCPPPGEEPDGDTGGGTDDGGDDGGGDDGGSSCDPQRELAKFLTSEGRRIDTTLPNYYDTDGSFRFITFLDWSATDNTGQADGDYDFVDEEHCSRFPCPVGHVPDDVDVPLFEATGPRKASAALTVETTVGARLDVSGSVQLYVASSGSPEAWATANADNDATGTRGLTGTITPAAGYEGVQVALGEHSVEQPVDTTAPVVTATPSTPPNGAGWHREDLTVALQASDDTEVASVSYRTGDAEATTVAGSTAAVPFTTEGQHTLTYWATDAAGNASAAQTLGVKLDKTAPVLQLPADTSLRAADSTGTTWTYAARAVDGGAVVPVGCAPGSGSRFPIGLTTVRCEARDTAGNSATGTFGVTVMAPATPPQTPTQRVTALQASVESLAIAPGARRPLGNKLDVVLKELSKGATAKACTQLAQFEQMVSARRGKQLDAAAADTLLAQSGAIRAAHC